MPFQSISVHFSPFQAISVHFGPFQSISGHFRPFQAISGHFRTFKSIAGHFSPFQSFLSTGQSTSEHANSSQSMHNEAVGNNDYLGKYGELIKIWWRWPSHQIGGQQQQVE